LRRLPADQLARDASPSIIIADVAPHLGKRALMEREASMTDTRVAAISRWVQGAMVIAAIVVLASRPATAQGDPLDQATAALDRRDYAAALRLLQPLADAGDTAAQRELGTLYRYGHGVPKDEVAARGWYLKAADQDDPGAEANLAIMYELGEGVPKDPAEAAKWFRKAADQGEPHSEGSLAEQYASGNGVPQDFVQAYLWYSLAVARGAPDMERQLAVEGRDRLAAKMTPAQIAEAHKLLRQWKPK
jgi:TPR repeat protein